jgi:ribonuclease Z
VPEVAFTGDTTAECFDNPGMDDVFKAKLLIVEMTFLDDTVTVEHARERGHMHIADFVARAHKFQNEAILFVHFSSRYSVATIQNAIANYLPPSLAARCTPFLNGWAQ